MKKFLFCLLVVLAICSVCFATEEDSDYLMHDDDDYSYLDDDYDEADYSYDLSDYDDLYSAYNQGYAQEELEEYYREYMIYSREEDAKENTSSYVRAKVVDTNDVKTTYAMDYYTPYKMDYQQIKVEILEGDYKGKIIDMQYTLSADTYGNMKISKAKVGDILYIVTEVNAEEGQVAAYAVSHDSRVQRVGTMVVIILAVSIAILIVGRVEGFKWLLLVLLIFDLMFLITVPQLVKPNELVTLEKGHPDFPSLEEINEDKTIKILEKDDDGIPTKVEVVKKSNSYIWIGILDIIVISGVYFVNSLGLSKRTLIAWGISVCVFVITIILIVCINSVMKMNGNTFEAVTSSESMINRNIDFNLLYIFSVLFISSVVVPNVISKVFIKYGNDDYMKMSRNYMGELILIIAVISVIFIALKVMVLSIYRYITLEMMNSEILLSEFLRMLVLIVDVVISMLLAEVFCKRSSKPKALDAAKE